VWSYLDGYDFAAKHRKAYELMERPNKPIRQALNEKSQINSFTRSLRSDTKNGRWYDLTLIGQFKDKIQKEKGKKEKEKKEKEKREKNKSSWVERH